MHSRTREYGDKVTRSRQSIVETLPDGKLERAAIMSAESEAFTRYKSPITPRNARQCSPSRGGGGGGGRVRKTYHRQFCISRGLNRSARFGKFRYSHARDQGASCRKMHREGVDARQGPPRAKVETSSIRLDRSRLTASPGRRVRSSLEEGDAFVKDVFVGKIFVRDQRVASL